MPGREIVSAECDSLKITPIHFVGRMQPFLEMLDAVPAGTVR